MKKRMITILKNLSRVNILTILAICLALGTVYAQQNKEENTHMRTAITYERKHMYDQAIEEINKAIEINPNDAIAYGMRGNAYLEKHQYDKAVFDLNKAIQINPNLAEIYGLRGATYFKQRNYTQAISDYKKFIELKPGVIFVYCALASVYEAKGDYGQALSVINKAIEIDISQALNCNGSFLDQDDIYSKIIDFLSDFAIEGRYFNLDYLTGKLQTHEEPLMRWDREICSEIMKRHYRSPNKKKFKERKMDIEGLENNAYMIFFKESGNEINDLSTFFDYGDKVSTKQKYSVFYIYQIIHYLLNVCSELETKGHFFPFLSEFYKIFGIEDKKIVLRKKSWNPVPPFYF